MNTCKDDHDSRMKMLACSIKPQDCCPVCGDQFDEIQEQNKCKNCGRTFAKWQLITEDDDYAWVR